jgi:exosortase/archaeosortase family protein
VAVGVLRFTGVDAQNQGTKILMFGPKGWRALNVAEACAGLRSLMTFISVGAAVAFLSVRPLWQKFLITLSAIPIAIFCNVMRVSGQGLLHRYVSEDWSEGFAHQFAGTVMLIPGFLFIVLVCWILDRIFIEVADDGPRKQRSTMVPAGAAPAAADWKLPKPPTAPSGAIARTVAAPAAAKPAAPTAAATVMPPRPTLAPKPAPGAAPRTPAAAAKPAGPAPATPQAPQARPPVQQKPVAPKPPVAGAQPVPPSRPAVAKPQAARPQQKQPLPPPPQQQKPTQPKPPEGA